MEQMRIAVQQWRAATVQQLHSEALSEITRLWDLQAADQAYIEGLTMENQSLLARVERLEDLLVRWGRQAADRAYIDGLIEENQELEARVERLEARLLDRLYQAPPPPPPPPSLVQMN